MKANSGMRAKAVPRDISSRKQDVQHLEMVPPANGCEATSKKASAPRLAIWPAYRESFASQRSSHCLVG